jgi:predicted MFS family arabinose efflux permease
VGWVTAGEPGGSPGPVNSDVTASRTADPASPDSRDRAPRRRRGLGATFQALESRSYRLYFSGQIVSVSGTWMQSVAQAWLVLKLSRSGAALGGVVALQTLPMLVGGAYGGVLADRLDRRRVLIATQAAAAALALVLGLLTLSGLVQVWMVAVLAVGLGLVNMVDIPTRQSFVHEMVGQERIANAVSLNSVVMNSARIVGPALAGLLIAGVGIAACFLVNAASYIAVIAGLWAMRPAELHRGPRAARSPGQLMEGLRYAWRTTHLRTPLLLMAVIGCLAFEFTVTLPLLARFTFDVGAQGLGAMSSVLGVGAVAGGLYIAGSGRPTGTRLALAGMGFGAAELVAAAAPSFPFLLGALALVGFASFSFAAIANSSLQLGSAPEMRGRVMALYAVAFIGSTPIGGPLVGWVGQVAGARAALALGGAAALVGAAAAWRSLRSAGSADQEALAVGDAQAAQRLQLGGRLDALGDDGGGAVGAEGDEGGGERLELAVGVDPVGQGYVQLDDLGSQAEDVPEAGEARAGVVHRHPRAPRP